MAVESRKPVFGFPLFHFAIMLDPRFALAHAGMASACSTVFEWHEQNVRWIERASECCTKALELEANLPEALSARARTFYAQQKYAEAIENARLAIERKADCLGAYNVLARAYFATDRWQEAAALTDRAVQVCGDDYNVYSPLINALDRLGRTEAATELRRRRLSLLEQHLQQLPEDVRARILLASNCASLGDGTAAVRELNVAITLRPNDSNVLYNGVCVYAKLGRKEEALDMMERALKSGMVNVDWYRRDPDLLSLRDEPRFQRMTEDLERRKAESA